MDSFEQTAGRIMVALDYPSASDADGLLKELQGIPCYMKVGMQLFYAAGPAFVYELKERGYHVFLDLKLHDIPNTVKSAAESVTRLGVDMFNVHASGGLKMMTAALEGAKRVSAGSAMRTPIVIGVTQLTSTDQQTMNEQMGISGSVEDSVLHLASLARSSGLQGIVASPQEVERVKREMGNEFIAVTPGIRPAGSELRDQARVMTPQQAFKQGSDYIVIGRPITLAHSPREALVSIIESITSQ